MNDYFILLFKLRSKRRSHKTKRERERPSKVLFAVSVCLYHLPFSNLFVLFLCESKLLNTKLLNSLTSSLVLLPLLHFENKKKALNTHNINGIDEFKSAKSNTRKLYGSMGIEGQPIRLQNLRGTESPCRLLPLPQWPTRSPTSH